MTLANIISSLNVHIGSDIYSQVILYSSSLFQALLENKGPPIIVGIGINSSLSPTCPHIALKGNFFVFDCG